MKHIFTTLDDWGFDYYKLDGEGALPKYVPSVDQSRLYRPSMDFIASYRDRLKIIRDTVGPKRFIEACPMGTPLNGIGYVDSYFNGPDLYSNWQGMYGLFSSITSNAFLNHLLVYVMPDGIQIGPTMTVEAAMKKRSPVVISTIKDREYPLTGLGVTLPQARTLVSYVALTGVEYEVASVMPELPAERVKLLQVTMPTLPIFPVDLFSRGDASSWDTFKHVTPDNYIHNFPEIIDLKVNAPDHLLAARIWVFSWGVLITLGTVAALHTIAPPDLQGWRVTADQILVATGLCLLLTDIFFLNVIILPFTGKPASAETNLAIALLKYILFFVPLVLLAVNCEPWIEVSVARITVTVLAIAAMHLGLRTIHGRIVIFNSGLPDLDEDEEEFPQKLGLR